MTGRLKRRHRSDRATEASSQIRPGDWSVVTDHAQLVRLFLAIFNRRSLSVSNPPLASLWRRYRPTGDQDVGCRNPGSFHTIKPNGSPPLSRRGGRTRSIRQMPPSPWIIGRHSSAPSPGDEEVGRSK